MTSPEEILKGSQKERSQESSEDLGGATDKKSKEQELEKAMSGMRLDTPVQEQKTCVASRSALMSACGKQMPQGPSVGGSNHVSDHDHRDEALSGSSSRPPTKEGRVSKKKVLRRGSLSVMQRRIMGRR